MSFNFRKVGKDAAALKAAVQAESAPQILKDELCRRIDNTASMMGPDKYYKNCVIVVAAQGHLETTADGSVTLQNLSLPIFSVDPVAFIDTPVA